MKISIVIPTYDAGGRGVEFVSTNISAILNQSFNDYEVIISDQSQGVDICRYVLSLGDKRIKYYSNKIDFGISSANLNNAISPASGDIIKPMFHDDYLYHPKALEIIEKRFRNGAKWGGVRKQLNIQQGRLLQ